MKHAEGTCSSLHPRASSKLYAVLKDCRAVIFTHIHTYWLASVSPPRLNRPTLREWERCKRRTATRGRIRASSVSSGSKAHGSAQQGRRPTQSRVTASLLLKCEYSVGAHVLHMCRAGILLLLTKTSQIPISFKILCML